MDAGVLETSVTVDDLEKYFSDTSVAKPNLEELMVLIADHPMSEKQRALLEHIAKGESKDYQVVSARGPGKTTAHDIHEITRHIRDRTNPVVVFKPDTGPAWQKLNTAYGNPKRNRRR